ncbi:MAG: putative baseplate assembly protein [Pseudomonadota bacterium]|nr:MAG: putative baseplate assembly protein [Pseudomonadota bacterium]
MPIRPPALDDRRFQDLVEEALSLVPAHVPEWTPRVGDPGQTLVELFAWLVDTLLYRANLIPEKQRLQFLRLLGVTLRPALPARGLVALALDDPSPTPVTLRALSTIQGPVPFETLGEVTVLPVEAACYVKRRPSDSELATLGPILGALPQVYDLRGKAPSYYVTTPVFADGAVPEGVDLARDTVDASLWIALLARDADSVAAARASLGGEGTTSRLLSVGWAPAIEAEALKPEVGRSVAVPHVFELTTLRDGALEYVTLEMVADSTQGLTRRGVQRLVLPSLSTLSAALPADETDPLAAGVGDRPPRIDDPELGARIVTWVRLRPTRRLDSLRVSWIGINAVEIDQRVTVRSRVFGTSHGGPDQEHKLPGESVDPESLVVQVEENGRWAPWAAIGDLALAGRDDSAYQLDAEAGIVRFGDGVRGRVPPPNARIRVELMRAGGGVAGNLPPFTLKSFEDARDVSGARVDRRLRVIQALPTEGGQAPETLAEAERRIPAWLRHRDRAVTENDYRSVAAETPGVALGRVEVLPQFKPHQRRSGVPGVVSVVVWPQKAIWQPPNPRADQPLREAVRAHLDERRPLGTELYVMGCDYVPIAASAGVVLRPGAPRDEVLANVRDALRRFLWALPPGGPELAGWPLGRSVRQRELEVVVAQVTGVTEVVGVNVFTLANRRWQLAEGDPGNRAVELLPWQLPELLAVTADVGEPHEDPSRLPNPYDGGGEIAIPVVPEVC